MCLRDVGRIDPPAKFCEGFGDRFTTEQERGDKLFDEEWSRVIDAHGCRATASGEEKMLWAVHVYSERNIGFGLDEDAHLVRKQGAPC